MKELVNKIDTKWIKENIKMHREAAIKGDLTYAGEIAGLIRGYVKAINNFLSDEGVKAAVRWECAGQWVVIKDVEITSVDSIHP